MIDDAKHRQSVQREDVFSRWIVLFGGSTVKVMAQPILKFRQETVHLMHKQLRGNGTESREENVRGVDGPLDSDLQRTFKSCYRWYSISLAVSFSIHM